MNSWEYALLEIYHSRADRSEEGTPADWIEQGLVSYCDGDEEGFISTIPLYLIIYWKIKWMNRVAFEYIYYRLPWVSKRIDRKFNEIMGRRRFKWSI